MNEPSRSPSFAISEAGGPQLQALNTLSNLGWRYLTRAEAEAQRRGRLSETLLEDVLTERLLALNRSTQGGRTHPVPAAAALEAIGRLREKTADLSIGLLGANAAATDLLLLGTSIPIAIDGETRGRQLRFIDWDNPANNRFHMTAEFPVERSRSTETRRPDIILFVNGIPVGVIEVKYSTVGTKEGVSQTIRNQGEDEIPRLFATAQLLVAANPDDPQYATVGTPAKFWALWRESEIAESAVAEIVNRVPDIEEAGRIFADFSPYRRRHEGMMDSAAGRMPTALDRLLVSLASPERLIRIIRGYMLFDAGEKKIARYQQFFGVREALRRLETFDERGRRKGGVIWHTQGSGKSLTMVMLAREIARIVLEPRIVLVTDRRDLDRQIRDTFKNTGLEVRQAADGRDLIKLVRDKAGIVTTVINKFRSGLGAGNFADESRDVFLLVDESHRSQSVKDDDSLHFQMRKVFPNACYIGFTGTPLLKREHSTFERFGGLIHRYAIDEAVRDKAVVPLLYEGRHVELTVDDGALDKWFERTVKGLTSEQIADLKRKMARGREVRGAEPWLREVAYDVSTDFSRNWSGTPYKAQLVAPSQRAAVLLKRLLDEFGDVTSEVVISPGDDRSGHEAVNEEPTEEVKQFWKGVRANWGTVERYEELVIERFKAAGPPDIVIVVDKLLTGFDAPRNRVLYLAKPLREHGLLQAIARVNRLFEDEETGEEKEFGHIIDYAGILGELDEALTTYSAFEGFDDGDVAEALVSVRTETDRLPDLHAAVLDLFKDIENQGDQEAFERRLADDLIRDDFYDRLRAFARALALAFSSEDFIARTDEASLTRFKTDLKRFENLRRSVLRRYADAIDYREYEAKVRKLLDKHVSASQLIPIVPPIDIFNEEAFKNVVEENGAGVASKADSIANATARTITERMEADPVLYERFSALVRQAIEDFRLGRITERAYLDRVVGIRNELVTGSAALELPAAVRTDGLASAVFRSIAPTIRPHSGPGGEGIIAEAATELSALVRRHRRIGWQDDRDVQNTIRNAMDDYLYDELRGRHGVAGMDARAMDDIMDRVLGIARRQLAL